MKVIGVPGFESQTTKPNQQLTIMVKPEPLVGFLCNKQIVSLPETNFRELFFGTSMKVFQITFVQVHGSDRNDR